MNENQSTIKLPAGQALQALQALQRVFEARFPAKLARKIAKAIAVLSANPDIIATEKTRLVTIRKYGVEATNGSITVPPEQLISFSEEYGPIATESIGIEMNRLPVEILDYLPDACMTPADMAALEPFWEEEVIPLNKDKE